MTSRGFLSAVLSGPATLWAGAQTSLEPVDAPSESEMLEQAEARKFKSIDLNAIAEYTKQSDWVVRVLCYIEKAESEQR